MNWLGCTPGVYELYEQDEDDRRVIEEFLREVSFILWHLKMN